MENKADIKLLEKVNQVKASKAELATTEMLITNLNDRLKHLSSVMNNLAGCMLPVQKQMSNFDNQSKILS